MARKRPTVRGDAAADAAAAREEDDRRQLFPLAAQLRLAYIAAYRDHWQARKGTPSTYGSVLVPRWDGGEDAQGRRHKPIWYQIVRFALRHGVAVDDLIDAAFSAWSDSQPPLPTHLMADEVCQRALANPGLRVENAATALEVQRGVLQVQVDRLMFDEQLDADAALRLALRNRRLEMSSVFRYCIAASVGDGAAAAEFEEGAAAQYAYRRDAYDRAWGDVIPARLRSLADRLLTA